MRYISCLIFLFNDWSTQLLDQTSIAADIARGFIFSEEFTKREVDDTTFVTILYKAFFDRAPDTVGFKHWTDKLNEDVSKEEVLNGFLYSDEFTKLAESYGIVAVR